MFPFTPLSGDRRCRPAAGSPPSPHPLARALAACAVAVPLSFASLLIVAGGPAVAQAPVPGVAPPLATAPQAPAPVSPVPEAGGAVSGSGSTLGGMGVRGGPGASSGTGTGLTGGGLGFGGTALPTQPRANTRIAQPPAGGPVGSGRAVDSSGRLTSPLAP